MVSQRWSAKKPGFELNLTGYAAITTRNSVSVPVSALIRTYAPTLQVELNFPRQRKSY